MTSAEIRNAIRRSHEDDDRVLTLAQGILELPDSSGRTPIFHAVLAGRDSLVEKLIVKGASPSHQDSEGRTPLHFAVYERNLHAARLLLEAGAPVDARDVHGNTPLWAAVMQFRDFEEMIEMLISSGASPDSRNVHGKSPRDLALSMKTGEVAGWLDRHTENRTEP